MDNPNQLRDLRLQLREEVERHARAMEAIQDQVPGAMKNISPLSG